MPTATAKTRTVNEGVTLELDEREAHNLYIFMAGAPVDCGGHKLSADDCLYGIYKALSEAIPDSIYADGYR